MQPQDLFLLTNGFTGLSELPGSCGTGLMLTPRRRFRRLGRPVANHFAIEDNPPGIRRALSHQQADNGLRGGGFPEPDSPTKASISPRWMEKLMLCTTSRHSPRER